MSHVEMTDKNVTIVCPECIGTHIEEGIEDMVQHVMNVHAHIYSYEEAADYVRRWAEDAYDQFDDWNYKHRNDRDLDRSIDADAFPDK